MFALKSAAAVGLLAVLGLAILVPSVLMQDAGPGKADDVAQVLPKETIAFLEIVKAPRLLHDWKDYVGSVTTEEGKQKACEFIENFFEKAFEIIPEKILKDLKEGLPSIQRLAVAMTGAPHDGFPWILVATSSDAAFLKKLVETDLAVFAGEEKAHAGVKVFAIRKVGDVKFDAPFYAAAAGNRFFLSTRWENMTDALDRAAGRPAGPDLRQNVLYARLAPAASENPAFRAFTMFDLDALFGTGSPRRGFGGGRPTRFDFDIADAVFGFRKIQGLVMEATFQPGKVASTLIVPVEPGCRLYDAFRQPAGSKSLLAHVPKKAVYYGHLNLKSGKEAWSQVETFMRRFEDVEQKTQPERKRRSNVDEMNEECKEEIDVTPAEIAEVIGDELLFVITGPGDAPGFENMFVGLARASDPAKAAAVMDKIAAKVGEFDKVTQEKITLWKHKKEPFCIGMQGTVIALGINEALIKEALASEDAGGALKRLPKEADTASGVLAFNPMGLADVFLKMSGIEEPEELKGLRREDWSTTLFRTEADQVRVTTVDAGTGVILHAAMTAMPFGVTMFFGMVMSAVPAMEAPAVMAGPPDSPEPPALPAGELAKKVAALVPQLRSEELVTREDATTALRALGRQAQPLLVDAYKAEKDAEARTRLANILVDLKAWDALPELLDRKADAFFDEVKAALDSKPEDEPWGGFAWWHEPDGAARWGLEPTFQSDVLAQLKNADVAKIPKALKRFAARVQASDLAGKKRGQALSILAFYDCAPAFPAILELRDVATDPEARAYLTIALGWSDDPKAKEAIYQSLASKETAIRRGAFLAAERMRDPEIVTRLLDRTKSEDIETRWNAGYTLRVLTGGKVDLNGLMPDAEFARQVEDARAWWEKNKAGFKMPAPGPGR